MPGTIRKGGKNKTENTVTTLDKGTFLILWILLAVLFSSFRKGYIRA